MLYLYIGTDRKKAHAALRADAALLSKKAAVIHITDAHTIEDLDAAISGGGLFAQARVVILDGVFDREDMRERILSRTDDIASMSDHFLLYTEKIDAATRKRLERMAAKVQQFDLPKKADKESTIFTIGNALRVGDKKRLWVGYQGELLAQTAPEAIHGVLFWAAKQMLLAARGDTERIRGKRLVAQLAELPHKARRRGEELEYALERFVLSIDVIK
ncbi:hypothetical protein FJY93_00360 [Candidatus Kaiserbacteria bacterium]|nr:hypothetical protein [Candidatus Kaiserbacteria bacterium]